MPSASSATSDSNTRARLTLTVNGRADGSGADWSVSILDNNANFSGFGSSGAGWDATVGGVQVVNAQNRSYDFGSGNVASPFFPRTVSGFQALSPGTYTASANWNAVGLVGSASVSFSFTVVAPPPFFPPYFPFFPFFPFFPSFTPAPIWGSGTPPSSDDAIELEAKSISLSASNTTSYSITSGSLPAGLSLNSSAGTISGTPSRNSRGTYNLVLTATGAGGTATTNLKIVVRGAKGVIQIYDTATSEWKEGVVHVYDSATSTWVESLVYTYDSSTSSWAISQSTYIP
jgi:hypothetical protein